MAISSAVIKAVLSAVHTSAQTDHSTPTDSIAFTATSPTIANGTGAGQANQIFHDRRTLVAAASEELDLSGSLTNRFGDTVTLTRVVAILIANNNTTSELVVGGAAANAFSTIFSDSSDKIVIRRANSTTSPSFLLLFAGDSTAYAVTAGTGDLLKIAHGGPGGTDIEYDIFIVGS